MAESAKGNKRYNKLKKRPCLCCVLAVYLFIIILFSFIYQCAYVKDPRSFTFNNEIREIRKAINSDYAKKIESDGLREISRRTNNVKLLEPLLDDNLNLNLASVVDNKESIISLSGYKYTIKNRYLPGTIYLSVKNLPESALFLIIENNNLIITKIDITDETIRRLMMVQHSKDNEVPLLSPIPISVPKDFREFKNIIREVNYQLESEIHEIRSNIDRVLKASTEAWSYWDFLYFSTITQTTVGYGDILPNTTCIRILVIIQVLIGVILIGFAAIFITRSKDRL